MKENDAIKVAFIYAEDKEREVILADEFLKGLGSDIGTKIIKGEFTPDHYDHDVYCMVGVKSLKLFQEIRKLGKDVLFFDKGYLRHRGPHRTWEYWRIAVNSHHPTGYISSVKHGGRRWARIAKQRIVRPKEWRADGKHVILAGSSEKYHAFCGLPEPTSYAKEVIKHLKEITKRPIIYRPKPTWYDAVRVNGANFSSRTESIYEVLNGAWCMVTHGSNAAFEAILEGIPTIILGNGIARPISSTFLDEVDKPKLVGWGERNQWLHNVAWCMFTEEEMALGLAWQALRPQFFGKWLDDNDIEDVTPGERLKAPKSALKKAGLIRKEWKKEGKMRKKVKHIAALDD